MAAALTAAAVLTLASQYGDWDPQWVVWQVTDAGTGHGESSGIPDAYNPAGPFRGLMQVWDANAIRFGYQPEEMYDPAKNLAAAHRLWLEHGTAPWPSAVKYPGRATVATDGICPFAEQIKGVTTFQSGYADRVGFCDHTAGGFLSTLRDPSFYNGAGVSTHFAVGRDGAILQFVNIFDTAWAQGKLGPTQSWPPFAAMGKTNPNGYLISTEHEDHVLANGVSTAIPNSQWTPQQYAADLKLKRWCIDEVKRVTGKDQMRFGLDSLAGHHMFDSVNRAECPGKAWRDQYRAQLYAALTATEDYGPMKLTADGSKRIEATDTGISIWNNNIEVVRIGGDTPGEISKNFNGTWYTLGHLSQDDDPGPGQQAPAVWSNTLND